MITIIYSILITTLVFALAYFALPFVCISWMKRRFDRISRHSGVVCLTFDDGPDPESTPAILDLLDFAGVKAVFFVLGEKAEQYPHLVRDILNRGHEIGSHGYAHLHAWKSGPRATMVDLLKAERILKDTLGRPPSYFRPPYGKMNLAALLFAWLNNKEIVFWNSDPKDYAAESSFEVVQNVNHLLGSGAVILMHDGRRRTSASALSLTVEALAKLLALPLPDGLRYGSICYVIGSPCVLTADAMNSGIISNKIMR